MNHRAIYDQVQAKLTALIPGFTVKYKGEGPWWMNALCWLMVHVARMPTFVTGFTTTIGHTVYLATDDKADIKTPPWGTLAHEGVHALDDEKHWYFKLTYLFPLVLAPLALLSLLAIPLSNWWLLNLVWLACLAPLPAPGRCHWERRGYIMSVAADALRHGERYVRAEHYQAWYIGHFVSGDYFYMCWNKNKAKAWAINDIEMGIGIANGTVVQLPHSALTQVIKNAIAA